MAWHDPPQPGDEAAVQAVIAALDPPQKAHVLALQALVAEVAPAAAVKLAWGVPFWFARDPLAYASPANKHVTIGMARGTDIVDKHGLLAGTGRSPIRKAIVKLDQPFPHEAVRDWLQQAIALPPDQ